MSGDKALRLESAASEAAAVFLQSAGQSGEALERLVIPRWRQPQWATLLSYTVPVELDAGQVLIQPKDADNALYFVVSGQLAVATTSEGDYSIGFLATITAGSVAGELAFFDGWPRSAKVWAAVRSHLQMLTLDGYNRYERENLQEAAQFLFAMARLLAIRVRSTTRRV